MSLETIKKDATEHYNRTLEIIDMIEGLDLPIREIDNGIVWLDTTARDWRDAKRIWRTIRAHLGPAKMTNYYIQTGNRLCIRVTAGGVLFPIMIAADTSEEALKIISRGKCSIKPVQPPQELRVSCDLL
jgi:hypothetical protein